MGKEWVIQYKQSCTENVFKTWKEGGHILIQHFYDQQLGMLYAEMEKYNKLLLKFLVFTYLRDIWKADQGRKQKKQSDMLA